MIRVTLANGSSELIERTIEPRRQNETLYDFMLRSAHETTLEAQALRALLDAHVVALAGERNAVERQRRFMLIGQSLSAGFIAALLHRHDTIGDALVMVVLIAVPTWLAGFILARAGFGFDRCLVRLTRWRRR